MLWVTLLDSLFAVSVAHSHLFVRFLGSSTTCAILNLVASSISSSLGLISVLMPIVNTDLKSPVSIHFLRCLPRPAWAVLAAESVSCAKMKMSALLSAQCQRGKSLYCSY